MPQDKYDILKQYFGYDSFRAGQEMLIDSILAGRDVCGVMPTGAGKSICFQVPAMLMDGITLVISPLISLMKDQVNALTQAGINAAFINSSLTERQARLALENARYGVYKIMYIAPERLDTPDFLAFVGGADIAMVTVDEAHCISQWGQDFRPSYGKIADFIESLESRPVVSAFTATATPIVREDIINNLRMKDPQVEIAGFDRKNLYFEVRKPKNKYSALASFLEGKRDKTGIVYCLTRKEVEEVCEKLILEGYMATRYHAGLSSDERQTNQDDFLYDRAQVMVATNAFGMGIDKSNVSYVVHYNMPKNLENYYQEAGRAGRDGEAADCLLLYSGKDVKTNEFLIEKSRDTEYAGQETEKALKERDRERLREMTFYCHTQDCLRAYILKYFGERAENFCGNCGNCNDNFETVDVTIEAKKILSCVYRMNRQFGIKMIIDTLRGSKSQKILQWGLDKLTTYNISKLTEKSLRDIINHLILNEYLCQTNDEYPVIKLGAKANGVLRQGERVTMKLAKDEPEGREPSKTTQTVPVDNALLDRLKALRLEIAQKQNVPAFVIFSNSTLVDMCMKRPKSYDEMLNVSGVGKVKLERYGKEFLDAIVECADYVPDEKPHDHDTEPAEIEISQEPVTVRVIADRISCNLIQMGHKKITAVKLNEWLIHKGYLMSVSQEGKSTKVPTQKGIDSGIETRRSLIRGVYCDVNLYSKPAQEAIAGEFADILEFVR